MPAAKHATGPDAIRFSRKARVHADKALEVLVQLMETGKDERVRQAAAARVLDLSFGRPATQGTAEVPKPTITLIKGDENL